MSKYAIVLLASLFLAAGCATDDIPEGDENVRQGDNSATNQDNQGDDDAGQSQDSSVTDDSGTDDTDNSDADDDSGTDDTDIDDSDADDGGSDGGTDDDSGGFDTGDGDTGDDADADEPTLSACEEQADPDATFTLPTDERAYYGKLTFTQDQIWAVYVAEVDYGGELEEKIHLARYGCDGQIIDQASMIGIDADVREYHPAIAADDETVFVAWVAEEEEGQRVRARAFNADNGDPLQSDPFYVQANLKTGETIGTIWKPDLAVTQDGDAVIVVEALTSANPRVIMQRFDAQGDRVLDGFYVFDSDDHGPQYDPSVAVLDDGTIQFAYLGGQFGQGRAFHGTVAAGADEVLEDPIAANSSGSTSQSVSLSEPAINGFTWMTYPLGVGANNDHIVRDATELGSVADSASSLSGRNSFYGDVAASDTGGATAWMSYESSPVQRRVHFQRFQAAIDGTITVVGDRVDQHNSDIARWPYGPSIVWLFGDTYAAVWTEDAGGLAVKGRIIELP